MYFDDAISIAAAIRRKEVSCREVLDTHLKRVEETNPAVNAVVTLVADRAQAEAAKADDRLAAGEDVGPLHGLPIAHKDLVATAGIRTTYGSPIFADHVPSQDDLIIQRLRAAGAITVGKTNVPELGLGSHTFNPVFGATRNPYDLTKSAGGSSGGAAAALATGMIPIADGSDTGGSLRNPASFCNVVGFRPSPGRVPSWPDPAPWSHLSTKGPMARTVADTALLLSVMAGVDTRSPIALEGTGAAFASPLTTTDLHGLRIAWTQDLGGLVPVDAAVTEALLPEVKIFEELGATVEHACPDLSGADEVFRIRRAWQLELGYGSLLDEHRALMKPDAVWNIELGRTLTGPDLGRAERLHGALHQRVHEFFQHFDVLLSPVSQVVPFDVELVFPQSVAGVEMTDYLEWMGACSLITVTGCPALSVPAAFTPDGLPVGLQIIGRHRQDRTVLEVGRAFEQACGAGRRRPPV